MHGHDSARVMAFEIWLWTLSLKKLCLLLHGSREEGCAWTVTLGTTGPVASHSLGLRSIIWFQLPKCRRSCTITCRNFHDYYSCLKFQFSSITMVVPKFRYQYLRWDDYYRHKYHRYPIRDDFLLLYKLGHSEINSDRRGKRDTCPLLSCLFRWLDLYVCVLVVMVQHIPTASLFQLFLPWTSNL